MTCVSSAIRIGIAGALLNIITAAPLSAQVEESVGSQAQDDGDFLTLTPQGEWKLLEHSDKCRISRKFGEGENATTLWIDRGGKEATFNVTIIGRPMRHSYGRAVRIKFGDEAESLRSYIRAKSSKDRPVLTMYGVALAPPKLEGNDDKRIEELNAARLAAIDTLRLSESIREPVQFDLQSMGAPLSFLRGCAEQLHITLARGRPRPGGEAKLAIMTNRSMIGSFIKYPKHLLRAGMDGKVNFRLTVNTKGKPTNCNIGASNRPQLFDDSVCLGLMKNAQFTPALNREGEPVPSYYWSRVTFRIRK